MSKNKSNYQRNYHVTWEQFHRDSRVLACKLLETKKKWDRIIAVARGGLMEDRWWTLLLQRSVRIPGYFSPGTARLLLIL